MEPRSFTLRNGDSLLIREAEPDDAGALLAYLEEVSGESDLLTFGPGEFELSEDAEREHLETSRASENPLHIVGMTGGTIASTLHFFGGSRPRVALRSNCILGCHQRLA